jgi:MerR family transcriptional regulator, light-induced transcriptional regulator
MDAAGVHAALMRAVVALRSREFIDEVVIPLQRRVGTLWSEGHICPAHEHLLSAQLGRVLGWLADTLPVPPGAPEAVAVTPAGHRHEFGAMLAAVVAGEEGWRVTYLGSDLPAADAARAATLRRARVVLVSVVMEHEPAELLVELRALRDALDGTVHILVGGRGAAPFAKEVERAGARILTDLDALRRALRGLHPGEEVQ